MSNNSRLNSAKSEKSKKKFLFDRKTINLLSKILKLKKGDERCGPCDNKTYVEKRRMLLKSSKDRKIILSPKSPKYEEKYGETQRS